MGDATIDLAPVAVGSGGGGRGGRQLAVRDPARVPVGPVDFVALDVDVHGIDAHVLVTLEGRLVGRVGVEGVHAPDLVVIRDVEDLVL